MFIGVIVIVIVILIIIYAIYHSYRVRCSKDYKIAFGILDKLSYGISISGDENGYLFTLEGFNIEVNRYSILVDGVKLVITNDDLGVGDAFPDPGYYVINRILDKIEDIMTKDKRDEEDMIKKDAFISLYKK